MDGTFKSVLEDVMLKAMGGNRSRTTQTVEAWGENTYEENFDIIKTEYEKHWIARYAHTMKMRQARKIHASV